MAANLDDAKPAYDLAKIDAIVAECRDAWGDDKVDMRDVAAISGAATHFGVTPRTAYYRSKSLGLLSYQTSGASRDDL